MTQLATKLAKASKKGDIIGLKGTLYQDSSLHILYPKYFMDKVSKKDADNI